MNNMKKILFCFFITFCFFVFILSEFAYTEDSVGSNGQSDYLKSALQVERSGDGTLTDLKLPNVFGVIIRFLFSLLIIIGFIFGAALVYKKFFGGQYFIGTDTGVIKVLAQRYLDPKKSLYLVEVGQKILVIGASTDNLQLISEITAPEEIRHIYKMVETKSDLFKSRDFKKVLTGFTKLGERNSEKNSLKEQSMNSSLENDNSVQSKIQKIKRLINEK